MTHRDDTQDAMTLDLPAVTGWLKKHASITAPLQANLISGGRSNLTYRITDAEGRGFVLRRPPLGTLLPGAHDMPREHRIMAALASSPVPVPPVVGLCTDDDVLGAPFYVTGFVDGLIVRTEEEAQALDLTTRQTAAGDLATTLVALHQINPFDSGLAEAGRGSDYLARQLHVWRRQLDAQKARDLPVMDRVHERLSQAIPEQRAIGIVHGDYRLDNVMIHRDGTVAAVLDWELWTLGDPLADLAVTMTYWTDSEDAVGAVIGRPTTVPGFGDREDFRRAYTAAGGMEMPDDVLAYYLAFASWRLAAILEGVYQRNRAGAYGDSGRDWKIFEEHVPQMARQADDYADQAGI
ncbi:MAG: phosphotransferase family protein [Euzebya sp.]